MSFLHLIRLNIDGKLFSFKTVKDVESKLFCKISKKDKDKLHYSSLKHDIVSVIIKNNILYIK